MQGTESPLSRSPWELTTTIFCFWKCIDLFLLYLIWKKKHIFLYGIINMSFIAWLSSYGNNLYKFLVKFIHILCNLWDEKSARKILRETGRDREGERGAMNLNDQMRSIHTLTYPHNRDDSRHKNYVLQMGPKILVKHKYDSWTTHINSLFKFYDTL